MFKFKSLFLFVAALALSFSTFSFANGPSNSLKALKGTYAYQISGEFGPTSLSNQVIETGIFQSDGKGHVTAQAISLINGQAVINVTYDGTYTVEHNIAYITVTRFSPSDQTTVNFAVAIADKTDTVFIQALPQPSSDFAFVNITGSGQK